MKTCTLALAALVAVAASCSSGGSTTPAVEATTTTAAPTQITGYFAKPQTAACETDLNEMVNAVEMYLVENGTIAVTEDALVAAGLLREPSTLHDIGADNAVIASPLGGCIN